MVKNYFYYSSKTFSGDLMYGDGIILDNLFFINYADNLIAIGGSSGLSLKIQRNIFIWDSTIPQLKNPDSLIIVSDVKIEQDFLPTTEGFWAINRDEMTVDFSITEKGLGMFAHKTVTYNKRLYNIERPDSAYRGVQKAIIA